MDWESTRIARHARQTQFTVVRRNKGLESTRRNDYATELSTCGNGNFLTPTPTTSRVRANNEHRKDSCSSLVNRPLDEHQKRILTRAIVKTNQSEAVATTLKKTNSMELAEVAK